MHRAVPALVLALCALAPAAISAEPTPQDAQKYRHSLFKTLGTQMMDLGMITQGKAGSTDDLLGHAIVLYETAKIVPHAFPKGSGSDVVAHSRALPKIWEDQAGFTAAAQRLITEAEALVKVAKKKDVAGVSAQLQQVGAACGGCHDAYRGPEHHDDEHEEHHE